jgi:hypothetical protein
MSKQPQTNLEASDTKKMEKTANELADYIYGKFHEFPEEEKWVTANKLRNSANDLMFFVAQAAANISPAGAEYEWSNAHKNANSLRAMYIFATKQKFIEMEPEIVVRIDELMKRIRGQSKKSSTLAKDLNEKELEHWREKYKFWKEINDEN